MDVRGAKSRVSPRILDRLGLPAYSSLKKCLSELAPESNDGDATINARENKIDKLIEANLWLVRDGLELWTADKPLKNLLEKHIKELYKDQEELRPDLVCRSRESRDEAVVLEFKRPKELVEMKHVTQALGYTRLIKEHRPNINLVTCVVGCELAPEVLLVREELGRSELHLWSFDDILQRARVRAEQILNILDCD